MIDVNGFKKVVVEDVSSAYREAINTNADKSAASETTVTELTASLSTHVADAASHVTPEAMAGYDTAIAGLDAHSIATDNKLDGFEARIARIEDGIFNNITGNPFLVSFGSLSGIALTKGVWNSSRQRIEC